jgi:8-oxo-dGTP pyrophosphatase MutT (NUDIX family)
MKNKTDQDKDMKKFRQLFSQVLELIPTHHQPPKTIKAIASELKGVSLQEAETSTSMVLVLLDLFGVLKSHDGAFQTLEQIPTYFLQSLNWYFKHNAHLLQNWTRSGVSTDVSANSLFEMAPHFLKAMELRRLRISKEDDCEATPSRIQQVVFTLIKGQIEKKDFYLHEWDRRAGQYQLIGGRVEPGESLITAARREVVEELDIEGKQDLEYERDFSLKLLLETDRAIQWMGISPTYGALTQYYFWVCSAQFNISELKLKDNNRWLSIDEMLAGETRTGKKVGDAHVYRLMDAQIKGGLRNVPISINIRNTRNYLEYIEVKPGIWGIEFDIKKMLTDIFGSKR